MDLSIKHEFDGFARDFATLEAQMPYIFATALTMTARDALTDLKQYLGRQIDRPRSFTINSMYVERATKKKLQAEILFRYPAGGRGAGKYLRSIAYGQGRGPKGFEAGLTRKGTLKAGHYAVPGRRMKLDAEGNVPGGVLRAMLSDVGVAKGDAAFSTTKSRKKRARKGKKVYFTPAEGSGLPAGVYERNGRGQKLAMLFVRGQPQYRRMLDMDGQALKTVNRVIDRRLAEAMQTVMKNWNVR